jgi:hypothetical protein
MLAENLLTWDFSAGYIQSISDNCKITFDQIENSATGRNRIYNAVPTIKPESTSKLRGFNPPGRSTSILLPLGDQLSNIPDSQSKNPANEKLPRAMPVNTTANLCASPRLDPDPLRCCEKHQMIAGWKLLSRAATAASARQPPRHSRPPATAS